MASAGEQDLEARLARLESVTDATLAGLDVDDLLNELLSRVRLILEADTAAVLLLDEGSGSLIARAACGIEEEVREDVRIPLGIGFAGRIAATKDAVRLDRIDATTVANPILWEKGIQAMLGVPLLSEGGVLGVLHVGRLEPRPFTDDDVELLQVVADRVAGAAQQRLFAIEQAAARLLERGLLPASLPKCAGLEIATRYAATDRREVGGDWYDVFELPSGELWVVVGDVAGHGLRAAVVMGRIRSALRAYALVAASPEEVLDLVDRKVQHFEMNTFATIVCAVTKPPYDAVTIAVAGHPPPVVAVPGQPATFVDVRISPPVGTGRGIRRESVTQPLPAGAVIALYTDGLVERRGQSLDVGLEHLRSTVSTAAADTVARDVMHKLVAEHLPIDDIALVVIRRQEPSEPDR
jgi:sigma-B regulation protein RsbU (phosphoserine phosphatase)